MWYIFPIFVVAVIDETCEGREAHSLIANIAGKVVMLQKDKSAAERGAGKKVNMFLF